MAAVSIATFLPRTTAVDHGVIGETRILIVVIVAAASF
jgi:hypothetical protein